jgi:hypothetical protein
MLKNTNATLLSEKKATVGGIAGRKVVASTTVGGQSVHLELYLAYDKDHRAVVGVFVGNPGSTASAANDEFVASFKVNPKGKSPPR